MLVVVGMILNIACDVLVQLSTSLTVLPGLSKFISCSWGFPLEARTNDSFLMAGHRGQEICCRLLFWTHETELFKVGLGFGGLAKKDLSAFIQHNDFIKDLFLC